MPKKVDMIGKRYGRLVAVKETGKGHNGYRYLFACDCGNQKDISGAVTASPIACTCSCLNPVCCPTRSSGFPPFATWLSICRAVS